MNKFIVLDAETTGLDNSKDEILQLSIINNAGDVLFDELIKPVNTTSWPGAEKVHGISPEDVKDCKNILDYKEWLIRILKEFPLIVGYNVKFDLGFLKQIGIDTSDKEIFDVMLEFAPIYGEYNDYFESYTWQKLSTCADYYGYKWDGNAHDSLADCKATLYCYYKILEQKQN